jgi:hypothetical protein
MEARSQTRRSPASQRSISPPPPQTLILLSPPILIQPPPSPHPDPVAPILVPSPRSPNSSRDEVTTARGSSTSMEVLAE